MRGGALSAGATASASAGGPLPRGRVAEVGMVVFLAAWAILFAALVMTWAAARGRAASWPPADLPSPPQLAGALATALLVVSSLALGGRAGGRGRRAVAALLGAGFLAVQLGSFAALWRAGVTPAGGAVASAFFAIAVAHAVHVAVGAVALIGLAARGRPSLWVWYWHFMAAVWLVLYAVVYLGHGLGHGVGPAT